MNKHNLIETPFEKRRKRKRKKGKANRKSKEGKKEKMGFEKVWKEEEDGTGMHWWGTWPNLIWCLSNFNFFQMFLSLQRIVFPENFSLKKLRSNLKENYNWRVYEHVWLTCCLVEGYIRTEARLGRGCRKEGTQLQAYKQYQGWL